MDIKKLVKEMVVWQYATFKHSTSNSMLNHLKEEISEVMFHLTILDHNRDIKAAEKALIDRKEKLKLEYADCFMLIVGSADRAGIPLNVLLESVQKKLEINKKRIWGEPNEKGYQKHIEEDAKNNK